MKYKKNITDILPINHNLTIKIMKEEVFLENFNKIVDIKEDVIVIDNFVIKGQFLKIVSIENRSIMINGKIKEILVL